MGRDTKMFATEEGEIWNRCKKEIKMRYHRNEIRYQSKILRRTE
jgi:hypothetical protein